MIRMLASQNIRAPQDHIGGGDSPDVEWLGTLELGPRKLHPVFDLKGGICVQKKDAQFPRVST